MSRAGNPVADHGRLRPGVHCRDQRGFSEEPFMDATRRSVEESGVEVSPTAAHADGLERAAGEAGCGFERGENHWKGWGRWTSVTGCAA